MAASPVGRGGRMTASTTFGRPTGTASEGASQLDRVVLRRFAEREPIVRFWVGAGDVPLVEAGARVAVDSPLIARLRHATLAETGIRGASPQPGAAFEAGEPLAGRGRGGARFDSPGRVLYRTPGGRVRAAVSRHRDTLPSPISGTVESVAREHIQVRADGIGLLAAFGTGEPAHGPLVIAVDGPDAEVQASRIDVRGAGAILVVGARVEVETITRARAMGVRGMVVGGMVGKDLRDMAASLARQEAALHASPPFALVVVDGYGKRPIPDAHWECLVAAAGTDVGLVLDPPMVVLDAGQTIPSRRPGRIRVAGGEWLGRSGQLLEFVGLRRQAGGVLMDAALVALEPGFSGEPPQAVEIPLADIERFA
jgi:hypothetical protein